MGTLGRKAGGADYEKFRAALALKESAGNPSAVQWDTKARGLFQFIPRWHADWIKAETGKSLDEYMPKDSSEAEMQRAIKEQTEVLFPAYYERELAPFVAKAKSAGISKDYSDEELAAMAHFAGAGGAEKFLRTGIDPTLGTVGNSAGGIPAYVKGLTKTLGGDPEAMFKAKAEAAAHYGEYGLGRGVYEEYKDKDIAKTETKARNQALKALYNAATPPAFSSEQLAGDEPEKKNNSPPVTPSPLPEEASLPASSPEPLMPPPVKTAGSSPSGTRWQCAWERFRTIVRSWLG